MFQESSKDKLQDIQKRNQPISDTVQHEDCTHGKLNRGETLRDKLGFINVTTKLIYSTWQDVKHVSV